MTKTAKVIARWLTRPYWSRLDGAVLALFGLLIGARPHWIVTEVLVLAAFMLGIRPLSFLAAKAARIDSPPTPEEGTDR